MTNEAIRHLLENYGSIDEAAKHSGMSVRAFRVAAKAARLESPPQADTHASIEATKDGQVITLKSATVRTLEQALAVAEVDGNIWEVEKWTANKWDMAAKTATEKVSDNRWQREISAIELWQIKVFLKRRMPKPVSDAIANMLTDWKFEIPIYETLPNLDRHLLEISLYDAHFGKLCWGPETLNSGDLKTSAMHYAQAGDKMLTKVIGYPIDRILLPIGNDFFHINNWLNTTGKGTLQDVDTRLAKIFDVGCKSVINLINRCVQVAPVDVMWIPGNHDPETSWFMAKVIEAYYHETDAVRVCTDPTWRKYLKYGTTLLGYTHGNEEKESDLPLIMATEQPDFWAATTCRSWRLGHFHTKRQRKYTSGDTINGVTIDYLPSISMTDAWHFRKGYVGNPKAGEAWLWSHDEGYAGQFPARVG